jgi:hypothetical protein
MRSLFTNIVDGIALGIPAGLAGVAVAAVIGRAVPKRRHR